MSGPNGIALKFNCGVYLQCNDDDDDDDHFGFDSDETDNENDQRNSKGTLRPKETNISPRYSQDIHKISPRYPQDSPKNPQDIPKIPPRCPKMSPRFSQDVIEIIIERIIERNKNRVKTEKVAVDLY